MITVGVRELKGKLSEYLRLVRSGAVVQVTDRGTVVAELRRPEGAGPTENRAVDQLIRDGVLIAAKRSDEAYDYRLPDRPALDSGAALRLLDETRGEG